MKIGIITNLYPPYARGGAENVIVRTVGQLMSMGHEVFVICGHPKKLGSAITLDGSSTERVYRFFPKNAYFTLDDGKYPWLTRLLWHVIDAFSWHGAEHVRTILRDEEPDVVITHNLKGLGLNIPSVIADLKIPYVHVVHDLQLIIPSGLMMFGAEKEPWYAKPAYAVYRALCRMKFVYPNIVIFPSRYLEEMYMCRGFFAKSRIVVMPNPAPKYKALSKSGRTGGPLKLLFAGQLGSHKGIPFLLDALAKLSIDVRLYIAGTGPLQKQVEIAAQKDKRIIYLGYTLPDELMNVFGVVDTVVVPSLCYENSPTVIYEAFMAGIPVIASRIGGVGELIQEGKTGYLFTPGDTEAFLQAVKKVDEEKMQFAERREEIRATMHEYELDRYCENLLKLLEVVNDDDERTKKT